MSLIGLVKSDIRPLFLSLPSFRLLILNQLLRARHTHTHMDNDSFQLGLNYCIIFEWPDELSYLRDVKITL